MNYDFTVEKLFKERAVKKSFEFALKKVGRASSSVDAVNVVANLEILEYMKYFYKLSQLLYPKETQEICTAHVDKKIINGYKDTVIDQRATLDDVKDDVKKLRKYITTKGYEVKNFETGNKLKLIKAIQVIEGTTKEDLATKNKEKEEDKE